MNKEKMLQMAERNLRNAQKALLINHDRKGITEQEIENLSDKVEYAQEVYDLIVNNKEDE